MAGRQDLGAIAAVAALDEPVRARLFDFVRAASGPVTREEAAQDVGISRKLAAFHLDKLVAAGLLESGLDDSRPRRVGRAPKAYRAAERALLVSIPHRSYLQLASILVAGASSAVPGEPADEACHRAAREAGEELGTARRQSVRARGGRTNTLAAVETALGEEGFEPYRPAAGRIRLRNCPFHPLAAQEPALVCGVNHAYLGGLLAGLGATAVEAELAPAPGECCVEIRRSAEPGQGPEQQR